MVHTTVCEVQYTTLLHMLIPYPMQQQESAYGWTQRTRWYPNPQCLLVNVIEDCCVICVLYMLQAVWDLHDIISRICLVETNLN